MPAREWEQYSMSRFPGAAGLAVAEWGRMMIRPDRRGHSTLTALATAAYHCLAGQHRTDVAFAYCVPGLLRHYRRLGLRPYGNRLISTPDGIEIPLVMFLSDQRHFDSVQSFFGPLVARHFGPGLRSPLDLAAFDELLEVPDSSVEVDMEAVWSIVEASLAGGARDDGSFLASVSPATVERLSAKGFVLRVSAGALVTEKGLRQRELFVVLDGLFEAFDGDRRLRLMSAGDVMGEIAFFGAQGQRTASVRAITDGGMLVVRHHAIDELRAQDPTTAAELLFELARVMATRWVTGARHINNMGS
jgi:hypothetical protein